MECTGMSGKRQRQIPGLSCLVGPAGLSSDLWHSRLANPDSAPAPQPGMVRDGEGGSLCPAPSPERMCGGGGAVSCPLAWHPPKAERSLPSP